MKNGPIKPRRSTNCSNIAVLFCSSSDTISAFLRDPKDNPVLSDAMVLKVDVILTGDRDFLEANLDYPQIFSTAMMLEYLDSIGI